MTAPPEGPSGSERVRTGPVEPVAADLSRPLFGKLIAIVVAIASALYLANLGFGVWAELPDVIPGVGNIDEATVTAILLSSLAYLGIRLPFFADRRVRPEKRTSEGR